MPVTRRPRSAPTSPDRARRASGGRSSASGTPPGATSRPAASRPASASRGRRPLAEQRTPRSLRRIAILAAILVMLAVTLVPTMRSYLRQQGQVGALKAKVSQQKEAVASLRKEQQQWSDPAYVEQQARERLKLVRPGETSYTVIDTDPAPEDTAPKVATPADEGGGGSPWYGQLWQSMVIADRPAETGARAPADP